jgi:hypothetical protein
VILAPNKDNPIPFPPFSPSCFSDSSALQTAEIEMLPSAICRLLSLHGKAAKQIKDADGKPILMLIQLRPKSIRDSSCNTGKSKMVFMDRRIVFMTKTNMSVATIGE